MKKEIIGIKLGMTQMFTDNGTVVPVTVVEAGPCAVLQKKTVERDGYSALKVGFKDQRETLSNKCEMGEFKKAGTNAKKYVQEIKIDAMENFNIGDTIGCDIFKDGEMVDVSGRTHGHGFAGVIKRWNHHHQRNSHGASRVHRAPGSMGSTTHMARVIKGRKLPGQYGNERVTIQNLRIFKVDAERNLLLIKGAVPGTKGALLTIKSAVKSK